MFNQYYALKLCKSSVSFAQVQLRVPSRFRWVVTVNMTSGPNVSHLFYIFEEHEYINCGTLKSRCVYNCMAFGCFNQDYAKTHDSILRFLTKSQPSIWSMLDSFSFMLINSSQCLWNIFNCKNSSNVLASIEKVGHFGLRHGVLHILPGR